MNASEKAAAVRANQARRMGEVGISHAVHRQLPPVERAKFIRALYEPGRLNTMQVVARMFEDFGLTVTEAEVCRAVRRPGEVNTPYRRRESP